jgi:radial spoke head protein 9
VSGVKADYYIAMGVSYSRFEFPEKTFYWCSQSNNMTFESFPPLNTQHTEALDQFANKLFTGSPADVLIAVEKSAEELEREREEREKKFNDRTSLDSTEEEDPASLIVRVNLKEIDRLHFHVRAIENNCQIIPKGAMKLTVKHEVNRNEAFTGLSESEAFSLGSYSYFRNVQSKEKQALLEADDAIFKRDFLDNVVDEPKLSWSV